MGVRKIEGEYIQKRTNTLLRYVRTYELKPIGVVYETHAWEPGRKRVRLDSGVRTWGFWVLSLEKRLRDDVHESIDITDIDKLRAVANEA